MSFGRLGLVRFRVDPKLVRVSLRPVGDQWAATVSTRFGPKAQSGKHADPIRALAIALTRAETARIKGLDLGMSWAFEHPYGVEGQEAMYRPGWHKRDRVLETHMEDPTLDPLDPDNLPHGWADWNAFALRHASRFICWAEPAPADPSEERYAVMKSDASPGAYVIWERISPNPDIAAYRSSGGFYDIPEEGREAVAWAKAAAADHKRQVQAILARSEGK